MQKKSADPRLLGVTCCSVSALFAAMPQKSVTEVNCTAVAAFFAYEPSSVSKNACGARMHGDHPWQFVTTDHEIAAGLSECV